MACALALYVVVAAPQPASSATENDSTQAISSGQIWTDTGVTLSSGDSVTITASGLIHFGDPPIDEVAPTGIPSASLCPEIAGEGATPFPAPGLDCWTLIGRIGEGPPFQVGGSTTVRVATAGELSLGVNDNELGDNSGQWTTTITVVSPSAAGTAPTAAKQTESADTPPPAAKSAESKSSLALLAALIVGALLLIGLIALAVRRRRGGAAPKAQSPASPTETVAGTVPESPHHFRTPEPGAEDPAAAALAGAFTDVNIFEVEFPDIASLRVGYNYFPEGTVLHWQVQQNGTAASGEFETGGGGNTYHFETIPLGATLDATPQGVDVQFSWAIGGVPFRYSVRREPPA